MVSSDYYLRGGSVIDEACVAVLRWVLLWWGLSCCGEVRFVMVVFDL